MFQIIASGTRQGTHITVVCGEHENDVYFFFNNHIDVNLEKIIKAELKKKHLVAGSYVPSEHEPINLKNVLEFYFFDNLTSIEVIGDIGELPFEEGIVY